MSYPPMPMKEAALSPADLLSDRALVRRRWSRICMVAALAAGVVAVIGIAGRASGWLVVDVVTGRVAGAVMLTLALLLLAVCLAPVRGGWRNAPRAVCAVVLACMLLGAVMFSALFSAFGETRYPSPDGRSVLVVTEGADVIDPLWKLSVRQPSPLAARTWKVGCFNGDDPNNSLVSVAWISPNQIEAVAESGNRYRITVDSSDSRPSKTISVGCDD